MAETTNITFPVGRIVEGSVWKTNTTDLQGRPLTVKSGPNAGQPKIEFYFGVAIPKGGEQHWNQTDWGQKIWAAGQRDFPQHHQLPHFAWKVVDGDSTLLNQNNVRPCDKEGFKGHWVVKFKGGFAPKLYNANGTAVIEDPESIKCGHYVQVNANITGNRDQFKPGLFINPGMVAHSGYGPEISQGPNPTAVGFGQGPAPAGMSAIPVGGLPTQATPAPAAAPAPTPIPANIPPNPAFLQPPTAPVVPPPQPQRVMTAKAAGGTYEQFIAAGWNDQQMIEQGYMAMQ